MFVDTQVVSYAYKSKTTFDIRNKRISSVAANEFLEVHKGTAQAHYFVPHPMVKEAYEALARLRHPLSKRHTDQLVLYFGSDYPAIIEYGTFAISAAINERALAPIELGLAYLPKPRRKSIRARAAFLMDNEVTCVPLSRAAATLAQSLLARFVRKHQLKRNFRNSVSDMLILAAAAELGANLVTEDNLLSRFAAEEESARTVNTGPFLHLQFQPELTERRRYSRDSKGYINRGWKVRFRNAGFGSAVAQR